MSTTTRLASWIALGLLAAANAHAATFSYHGTLQDGGRPAEGRYDLELTLYAAASGGSALAGPLTLFDVPVHGGNFSTEAEFGPLAGVHGDTWLDVKVRAAGSGDPFAALSARSPVTASATASVCPGAWTLVGNTGNPAGSYLGTGDANPLVFDIAGAEVGRFSTDGNFSLRSQQINAATELTIGGSSGVGGYANLFMHQNGASDGMLLSVGEATPGSNNANFYLDNFQGSTQHRRLSVHGNGTVSINADPIDANTELTIGSRNDNYANLFLRQTNNGSNNAGVLLSAGAASAGGNDAVFLIDQFNGAAQSRRVTVTSAGMGVNATTGIKGGALLNDLTLGTSQGSSLAMKTGADQGIEFTASGDITTGLRGLSLTYQQPGGDLWAEMLELQVVGTSTTVLTAMNGATTDPNEPLVVGTNSSNGNGAYVTPGGVWTNGSSRSFKEAFARIDPMAILDKVIALPISTWQYRNDAAEGRHLGPVAEDFIAAFGLGNNERYISTADEEGVALAAIQGLNARLQAQSDAMRAEKDAEIAELRAKLDALGMRLAALEADKGK